MIIFSIIDALARLAALFLSVVKPRHRFAVERRLRGWMAGPLFAAHDLTLGRVQIESFANLKLAPGVKLYCRSVLVPGAKGMITIGARTHLGYDCVLSGGGGITIGSGCAISSGVIIYSVTNIADPAVPIIDSRRAAAVHIGNDVLIGMGARILPGVTIGDHAVIGAGAVVTRDVLAGTRVGGVPARPVERSSSGVEGAQTPFNDEADGRS